MALMQTSHTWQHNINPGTWQWWCANNTVSINRRYLTLGIGTIHGRNNNEHKTKKKVKTNTL